MSMELLAPAGTWDCLVAAVQCGADAVYLGGAGFGARAAVGFDAPTLEKAVRYAHLRGVRIYMTVNTLIKDTEWNEVHDQVATGVRCGVDAYLVQDIGLAARLQDWFPGICLHASTQMSVHNREGVDFALSRGLKRVVVARECTLEEIAAMRRKGVELEVFAHGALCASLSGQCLCSSLIGGRSGNRGRCAQPCRLPFTLNGETFYPLSMADLCALNDMEAYARAGVASVKLEGRLKRPEYVALVTSAYRQAIDLAKEGKKPDPRMMDELLAIFNRGGFTRGHVAGLSDAAVMAQDLPNHRGIPVGTVLQVHGESALVQTLLPIHKGDGLEARGGLSPIGVLVEKVDALPDHRARLRVPRGVKPGMTLHRTTDAEQIERLQALYSEETRVNIVDMRAELRVGAPAVLCIGETRVQGETVQKATRNPLSEEMIRRQLLKLGDTVLEARSLTVERDEDAFLPLSSINALRRHAVEVFTEQLLTARRPRLRQYPVSFPQREAISRPERLLIHQSESVDALLAGQADLYYWQPLDYTDIPLRESLSRLPRDKTFLVLPTYLTQEEQKRIAAAAQEAGVGFVANNVGQLALARVAPLVADASLNVFNAQTAAELMELGIARVTASLECTLPMASGIAKAAPTEMIVYGPMQMMTLRACPYRARAGKGAEGREACRLCGGRGYTLTDRKGETFPLIPYRTENGCTVRMMNAHTLNILPQLNKWSAIPFAALRVIGDEAALAYARAVVSGGDAEQPAAGPFTNGLLFRGVE